MGRLFWTGELAANARSPTRSSDRTLEVFGWSELTATGAEGDSVARTYMCWWWCRKCRAHRMARCERCTIETFCKIWLLNLFRLSSEVWKQPVFQRRNLYRVVFMVPVWLCVHTVPRLELRPRFVHEHCWIAAVVMQPLFVLCRLRLFLLEYSAE